jgi:hypothetical protein
VGGGGFGRGATLRFLLLLDARLFLRLAGFFGLAFARGLVLDAAAVLRLHTLAFAARGFLALAFRRFRGFDFLALQVGLRPGEPCSAPRGRRA